MRRQSRYITAAGMALVAVIGAASTLGGTAASRTLAHGGAGLVTADGRVGNLHIDRSTPVDVQRFAGAADYLGIGAFRSGNVTPRFLALGYQCKHVKRGGIPTSPDDGTNTPHPRFSGVDCATVYFFNERTNKLALFTTRSPRFVTALGTRAGMTWSRVKERGHRYVNCAEMFVLRRHSSLFLSTVGRGRLVWVSDVGVESRSHPLGLECPEW